MAREVNNPKINEPPDFYDKVINPPWKGMSEYDQSKWLYDIWKRGGGYNSYIPNLIGLRASVQELNYSIGLRGPIQAQLDAKPNIDDLGTMSTQDADNVAITGGTLENVAITESTGEFSELSAATLTAETIQANFIRNRMGSAAAYSNCSTSADIQSTPVGNVGTAETTLMEYDLPASAFTSPFETIRITAFGDFAANLNNKRLKVYFGSAIILDTGVHAPNQKNWHIQSNIVSVGASAQHASTFIISDDSLIGTYSSAASPSEDSANSINIKVTGEGIADDDIIQNGFIVEWMRSA